MSCPVKTVLSAADPLPALGDLVFEIFVGFRNQMMGLLLYFAVISSLLDQLTKKDAVEDIQFDLEHAFSGQVVFEGDELILNLIGGIFVVVTHFIAQCGKQDCGGREALLSIEKQVIGAIVHQNRCA